MGCSENRNCSNNSVIAIQPKDPSKRHFYVSIVKSILRIVAGVSLIIAGHPETGWLLLIAEVLGIVEELV